MYVNDGEGETGDYMNPNQLFWTAQGFAKVSSTSSTSISYDGAYFQNSPDGPGFCSPGSSTGFGWPLTLVGNTTAGLPATIPNGTIVLSTTTP